MLAPSDCPQGIQAWSLSWGRMMNPYLPVQLIVWATSLRAVAVRRLFCVGFFFSPPSYVALWDSRTPHRSTCERASCCLETPSPGQVSVPNSFVCLFVFYILSYLLSKRTACLSRCLVSSASIQKLFCGNCSTFKWSFDEFVGEKTVSPSYSSTILGLPLSLLHLLSLVYWFEHRVPGHGHLNIDGAKDWLICSHL